MISLFVPNSHRELDPENIEEEAAIYLILTFLVKNSELVYSNIDPNRYIDIRSRIRFSQRSVEFSDCFGLYTWTRSGVYSVMFPWYQANIRSLSSDYTSITASIIYMDQKYLHLQFLVCQRWLEDGLMQTHKSRRPRIQLPLMARLSYHLAEINFFLGRISRKPYRRV